MSTDHPFNMYRIFFSLATPDAGISNWLERSGHYVTESTGAADVIVFPGGADVTPSLYGQEQLRLTRNNWKRDLKEIEVYQRHPHIPKVGICRGSQFLNVMCGGSLWQDIDNHATGNLHKLWCYKTHRKYEVTSTHHQQMIPSPHGDILATANLATRKISDQGQHEIKRQPDHVVGGDDVEAVWYKDEEVLCYQPHPEYGVTSCEFHFWSLFEETIYPIYLANRGITSRLDKVKEKVTQGST